MKKAEQGKQTKNDLLKLGANLFALHGYHLTSTNDLLESASISKGAFYYHFNSKEDFALAILSQLQEDCRDFIVTPVNQLAPDKRLKMLLDKMIELNVSGDWVHCLLLSRFTQELGQKQSNLSEKVNEIVQWLMNFIAECIREAQKSGQVSLSHDADQLGQIILMALLGALSFNELEDSQVELKPLLGQLQSLIFTDRPS